MGSGPFRNSGRVDSALCSLSRCAWCGGGLSTARTIDRMRWRCGWATRNISAWTLASLVTGMGYSSIHDVISRLAAVGADTRWLMTTGFVVPGVFLVVFGRALRRRLSGEAWWALVLTGMPTLGVAATPFDRPSTRCTEYLPWWVRSPSLRCRCWRSCRCVCGIAGIDGERVAARAVSTLGAHFDRHPAHDRCFDDGHRKAVRLRGDRSTLTSQHSGFVASAR
jgi:hypothetical protein